MNWQRAFVVGALVVGACAADESPGDKQEWSILQALEWSTRGQTTATVRLEKSGNYEVIGVPRIPDSRIVWILLKPTHGSRYKQMPEGNYWLDRDLLAKLRSENRVTLTVGEVLGTHVRPNAEAAVATHSGRP
jgi:hypothetical protein